MEVKHTHLNHRIIRRTSLLLGGIFPEILRVLRSDRRSVAFFWRRRVNQLRSLFKS